MEGAPFDRRLVLPAQPRECWIVLTYAADAVLRPLRPMVRMMRADGSAQDFVLPGIPEGRAFWLGYLPPDLAELRLAVDARSGFVLERVGLRRHASVFAECLAKRPLRAGPALYHFLRGDERRFRDILRGSCAVTPLSDYGAWAEARARGSRAAPAGQGESIRLILPAAPAEHPLVARTIESLRAQTSTAWTLLVAWSEGVGEPMHSALDEGGLHRVWPESGRLGDLLDGAGIAGFLAPGDRLADDALAQLAAGIGSDVELIYADEVVDAAPPQPRLKPDWSPDLALLEGYQGRPILYAGALLARLAERPLGRPETFLLDLSVAAAGMAEPSRVAHLPRILCRSAAPAVKPDRAAALERHLAETGSSARISVRDGVLDFDWPLPDPAPLVSVIIPSKDRLDLIACSARGVLQETAYAPLELIIVDNGSTDAEVLAHYAGLQADPRVRIEPFPAPFNFSAMVNAGVAVARGPIVVLLNNDVAILQEGWLDALVRQASRPEVGAVGAKLLYENGSLQHGGVVVGLGGRAGHILRRRPGDAPGHLGRMRVAHEVSAVTAACLAVRRELYDSVGGFDAEAFPIDFNDVDFCLRLGAAGHKTIWTPRAVLSHLESVTRGPPTGEERLRFEREGDRFAARWRDIVRHDPFYHPALSLTTFGEELE
ncbi:hypothetical protein OCOJLMKI_5098 [Methylobacterium iners]|uniref:Glycosyltransferase 2-like domain-containing protein n=2 Tax=Methylobacterium iners TaxID=418707 RepID=A0ABQ4S7L2_9HYPH|nr:hypothetical protein OCOJLMKI_5098 [Methylobacterium iners]